jgi:hypothetical protein
MRIEKSPTSPVLFHYLPFGELHQHSFGQNIEVLSTPFSTPVSVEQVTSFMSRGWDDGLEALQIAVRDR